MNKERPDRLPRRRYEKQRITAFTAIVRVVLTLFRFGQRLSLNSATWRRWKT